VIGAGPIGLAVTQFAVIAGAHVIVADISEDRLRFCSSVFSVDTILNDGGNLAEALLAINSGDLPSAVFDATGNPQSMEAAFSLASSGGRLVFVGLVQANITFSDPEFHRRELTLLATRNSTASDLRRIIGLMETGKIDTTPWITHRAHYTEMTELFPVWLRPESRTIKAVVEF